MIIHYEKNLEFVKKLLLLIPCAQIERIKQTFVFTSPYQQNPFCQTEDNFHTSNQVYPHAALPFSEIRRPMYARDIYQVTMYASNIANLFFIKLPISFLWVIQINSTSDHPHCQLHSGHLSKSSYSKQANYFV